MKFTRRQNRLLSLAAEIVRLRDQITLLEAEFRRVAGEAIDPNEEANEDPISTLPKVSPTKPMTLKTQIMSYFVSRNTSLLAGEIVKAFPTVPVPTLHAALSKLAADGRLRRIRFGHYEIAGVPEGFGSEPKPKAAISEETKAETPESKDPRVSS